MSPPYSRLVLISVACISSLCLSESPQNDRIQVAPPLLQIQTPSKDASPDDLEKQGDLLRARKEYLDAVDYYRAAIAKQPSASVLNKLGIAELMLERYRDAGHDFERALKIDRKFAEPYNNLGVVDYKRRKYGSAIKLYKKSIALVPDSASFYSNLGAAYFAKKEFEQAIHTPESPRNSSAVKIAHITNTFWPSSMQEWVTGIARSNSYAKPWKTGTRG